MARAGVGVDIVSIARMQKALDRTPAFATRIFTEEERYYCEHKTHPAEHYAARLAAREAVLKALGCGFSDGVGFGDVSVSHDDAGRPICVLAGRAAEIAQEQGIEEVAISLSHTREVAVANAVALTAELRPYKPEKPDPKAELARSFKEAKSLIDELENLTQDSMQGA